VTWRGDSRRGGLCEKITLCAPLCYNWFSGDARHMISATRANIPALCGFVQFFGSIKMSTVPAVSAVPAAVAFSLSADQAERISVAAEMSVDATFDFSKACDAVGDVFLSLKAAGLLSYESWEVVRVKFVTVGEVRARDNGTADPKGAAGDVWDRITRRNKEVLGLEKPKKEGGDAERMRAKREADAAKALEVAAGRSAAELAEAQMAMFAQATAESIAQARALDAVIKLVEKQEKDAVDAQMKPLVSAARDSFKRVMDHLIAQKDQRGLADLVVMLGDFEPPKQ
jgi:hypothetical protein